MAATRLQVIGEPVIFEIPAGQARLPGFAYRTADSALDFLAAEAAKTRAHVALQFLGGHSREDVDSAARGVAPVKCALRAFEHFYPFDIQELRQPHLRPAQINPVHVDGNAWIDSDAEGIGADPAHVNLCFAAGAAERHARHLNVQVHHVVHGKLLQGVTGNGSDCDRHILKACLPLFSSHNDFLKHLRFLGHRAACQEC